MALGPPGTGRDTSRDRVRDPRLPRWSPASRFATATEWVARLAEAKHDEAGSRTSLSAGCGRIPLLIVDEVGYIPFDPQAANLMFALVSSRYERASMIVTSNKPFSDGARSSATTSSPPR